MRPGLRAAVLLACAASGAGLWLGWRALVAEVRPRVLVVGFDGASMDVIEAGIRSGQLRNLARLAWQGSFGMLRSTVPASSPPAWTSAITGKNPGKHGIYGFLRHPGRRKDPTRIAFNNALDRRAEPIWSLLTRRGLRSVVVNVPLTYPPDPVAGVMISGFPIPDGAAYVHPPDLDVSGYRIDVFGKTCAPGQEAAWLADLRDILEKRQRMALRLLEDVDWDLGWVVFTFPDRIQHFFLKHADPTHPNYEPRRSGRYAGVVREAYLQLDLMVGELEAVALEAEASLLILSDHGFRQVSHALNVNTLLRAPELLEPETGKPALAFGDFFSGKFHVRVAGHMPGGWVPAEGREEICQRLEKRLWSLRDPATGEAVVDQVYRREQLYSGPCLEEAPDVVALEKPSYLFIPLPGVPDEQLVGLLEPDFFSGFHSEAGVLFLKGPEVLPGHHIVEANIVDIAPTVLYLLGQGVPEDYDGRVLEEALHPGTLAARPVLRVREQALPAGPETKPELEPGVEEQLRALGYVR